MVPHLPPYTSQVPVLEAYAMSEASHQMTSNPLPKYGPRKPGSVGKAQGSVQVTVLDANNSHVPVGKASGRGWAEGGREGRRLHGKGRGWAGVWGSEELGWGTRQAGGKEEGVREGEGGRRAGHGAGCQQQPCGSWQGQGGVGWVVCWGFPLRGVGWGGGWVR